VPRRGEGTFMKLHRLVALATLAGCLWASGPAHAVLTSFTSKAAFDAAIAGMSAAQTVDFEHAGQGPGLTLRDQGESAGSEQVTLNNAQLRAHNHTVTPQGSPSDATLMSPANGVPATKARTTLYAPEPGTVPMSPVLTSPAGGNAPVPVMQPYLVLRCFIALQGVFPSRN